MAEAIWMDEDYIMANSPIADNADLKVITPNILFVQEAFIKPLIGSDLFAVVEAEINAQTYTSRITTLLNDHLLKVILNYVLAESAPDFAVRWMNKGLMQKDSENSKPISEDLIKLTSDRYKNRAEVFAQRCTNFLIQENLTYPEYYNGNNNIDDIAPIKNSFRTGIYLGDSDDDDCYYRKHNV